MSVGEVLQNIGIGLLAAAVLVGAVPSAVAVYQFLMVAVHRWRDHYRDDQALLDRLPRVAVVVPAWNEAPVLRTSVDQMMAMDYPADLLRVVVVDDASTDETPALLAEKQRQYPGRVVHLRRENGGQGKSHTLNHGLARVLADDWAEAVLITDADVVFEPTCVRRMVRHFADPGVGAVSAFIEEASAHPNSLNRFIGFEYAVAQASGRRAQNVAGAQACLPGGAQLHTRANLDALGGRIDTSTLAEDTVTTFETQLASRRVVFDGNARCLAEEPGSVTALWKQRLRWSRGNIQVSRRFRSVFFRPWQRDHHLGRPWLGLAWWSTLLLPGFMVCSSAALVLDRVLDASRAEHYFAALWIFNALAFVFTTVFALLAEPAIARRTWVQAFAFPGLLSLGLMARAMAPHLMGQAGLHLADLLGVPWTPQTRSALLVAAYLWTAVAMAAAWLVYRLDRSGRGRWLVTPLVYLVGYGPLLCAITFAAYVAEARGQAATWEKTVKTGKVATR